MMSTARNMPDLQPPARSIDAVSVCLAGLDRRLVNCLKPPFCALRKAQEARSAWGCGL